MAIVINTINTDTFSFNGKTYSKIYQPLGVGTTQVSLYNTYDTRFQLLDSTPYSEFIIDTTGSYASQDDVIQALIPVIYNIAGVTGGTTPSGGSVNVWGGANNRRFQGRLDNAMLWNRRLTDAEVTQLFSANPTYLDLTN